MVRLYGKEPYKVVMVHGGPGAIGSFMGSMVGCIFAEKYPEIIENVIMIGSEPLEDKYVSEISSRRFQNLSDEDGVIFRRLINNQATDITTFLRTELSVQFLCWHI